jgi:hypothetical protein
MSLASYVEVRQRIENVQDNDTQMFLKALYLLGAARPVEITAKRCSGENKEIIYGPKGTDVWLEEIDPPNPSIYKIARMNLEKNWGGIRKLLDNLLTQTLQVAVFKINLSRRKPKSNEEIPSRLVALPMLEKFEPWTKGLFEYFKKAGDDYVFQFNRAVPFNIIQKEGVFKGLKYPIKSYDYHRKSDEVMTVKSHLRNIKLEGLRLVRVDELREKNHFDDLDLAVFTGSKITISRVRGIFEDAVVKEDWHRYIMKLCI